MQLYIHKKGREAVVYKYSILLWLSSSENVISRHSPQFCPGTYTRGIYSSPAAKIHRRGRLWRHPTTQRKLHTSDTPIWREPAQEVSYEACNPLPLAVSRSYVAL